MTPVRGFVPHVSVHTLAETMLDVPTLRAPETTSSPRTVVRCETREGISTAQRDTQNSSYRNQRAAFSSETRERKILFNHREISTTSPRVACCSEKQFSCLVQLERTLVYPMQVDTSCRDNTSIMFAHCLWRHGMWMRSMTEFLESQEAPTDSLTKDPACPCSERADLRHQRCERRWRQTEQQRVRRLKGGSATFRVQVLFLFYIFIFSDNNCCTISCTISNKKSLSRLGGGSTDGYRIGIMPERTIKMDIMFT